MKNKDMIINKPKYVDCIFAIEDISKCRINGVSSTAQTIKHLPFLSFNKDGFCWKLRIMLNSGKVVSWPKGINAVVNFDLNSFSFSYFNNSNECISYNEIEVPSFLQLDLIDTRDGVNFTINRNGYIKNWPIK